MSVAKLSPYKNVISTEGEAQRSRSGEICFCHVRNANILAQSATFAKRKQK